MGRAEGVVDKKVAEGRELGRQCGIVGFFAGIEPGVLHQDDAAPRESLGGAHRGLGRRIVDEADGRPEGGLEGPHAGPKRVFRIGATLGAAKVRQEDDPRPLVAKVLDGRERGPDPGVIGDHPVFDRAIEVDPDQRPPAVEPSGVDRGQCPLHAPWAPMNRIRSTHRAEYPISLSYHEDTWIRVPSTTWVDNRSTVLEARFPT